MPAFAIPAILGGISGLIKTGLGIRQNNLAKKVVVPDATYTSSPYAKAMLDAATQFKNSRMTGAGAAERNIQGNNSNTQAGIQRNSTDGSQSLAMLAAAQGQTDQSFENLRLQEGQDQMNKVNNWNIASDRMIGEGDKEYQDRVRKQNMAIQEKSALRGAATANIGGGMNDMINGGMAYVNAKNGLSTTPTAPGIPR